MSGKRGTRARVFEIVMEDGYNGFSEQNITNGLLLQSIKQWAYILHDKDVHDINSARKLVMSYNPSINMDDPNAAAWVEATAQQYVGTLKKPHWHIVGTGGGNQILLSTLAKAFNVPEHMIEIPKGTAGRKKTPGEHMGIFYDKVEYLTHEREEQQQLGKYRYDDSKVKANFDWRKAITERNAVKARYGRFLFEKDRIRTQVLYEGLTLRQLKKENPLAYMNDDTTLKRFRLDYINSMEPPNSRMNFYLDGPGGIGKGLMARALARSFFQSLSEDGDIFFEVGSKGSLLEGYDGQPVIIWNDRRAVDLLSELDGRGNVFTVFDTHPSSGRQNVKYSSVNLCNTFNIINGIEGYRVFVDGLAGSYTDKNGVKHFAEDESQSYRRIPFIMRLYEDDFDFLLNKGFVDNTREYGEYYEYTHIRGNMKKIMDACGANKQLAMELQGRVVKPVVDKCLEVMEEKERQKGSDDEIRAMFADYGTPDEDAILCDEVQEAADEFNRLMWDIQDSSREYTREALEEMHREWLADEAAKRRQEQAAQREKEKAEYEAQKAAGGVEPGSPPVMAYDPYK